MKVGVPKEIKEQEHRVAVLPSVVYQLTRLGHQVYVEKNAGSGAGFPDEEYVRAGAVLLEKHEDVFHEAALVVKVKEPLPSEYSLHPKSHIPFTYLPQTANKR